MKGYMIFVEGGNTPQKVHRTHQAALREAHRLGKMFVGRRVTLMQVCDNFRYQSEEEFENLGSHLPADGGILVDIEGLVRGKTLHSKPSNERAA